MLHTRLAIIHLFWIAATTPLRLSNSSWLVVQISQLYVNFKTWSALYWLKSQGRSRARRATLTKASKARNFFRGLEWDHLFMTIMVGWVGRRESVGSSNRPWPRALVSCHVQWPYLYQVCFSWHLKARWLTSPIFPTASKAGISSRMDSSRLTPRITTEQLVLSRPRAIRFSRYENQRQSHDHRREE